MNSITFGIAYILAILMVHVLTYSAGENQVTFIGPYSFSFSKLYEVMHLEITLKNIPPSVTAIFLIYSVKLNDHGNPSTLQLERVKVYQENIKNGEVTVPFRRSLALYNVIVDVELETREGLCNKTRVVKGRHTNSFVWDYTVNSNVPWNANRNYDDTGSCLAPKRCEIIIDFQNQCEGAPRSPVLILPEKQTFKDGDKFMAQCVVANGRPAAQISWFLGSEEILAGKHQPVVTLEPGSDLQTISQNFSKTLTDEDDTKILICRAQHEALEKPKEARRQLIVQYPPKRQTSGTITIFGQKLGTEGRLNVTVRANPKPTAEWTFGKQVLLAPHRTDSGEFTAIEPLLLGNGFYNITLIVARISKEDVDRTYYLRVDNGLGREEFAVRISTMDEPVPTYNGSTWRDENLEVTTNKTTAADAKSNTTTTLIISIGIISGTLFVVLLTMVIWKCCFIKRNPSQLPTNAHTEPFYLNMLFRKECDEEIEEIELHTYEEINPQVSEGS